MVPSLHPIETAPIWRVRFISSAVEPIPLTKALTICGRDPNCDIVLPTELANRQHFQIHRRDGGCYLEDLHSRCGTCLELDEGHNNGALQPDCGTRPGGWQIIGLTPLRVGDVFGHPACYLNLERTTPFAIEDWNFCSNSQGMLLAIRNTELADASRLRQFLERCMELIPKQCRNEIHCRRLREHPDVWSAATGLARYVVAASTRLLANLEGDVQARQPIEAEVWRACEDSESLVCDLLREIFRFESGRQPT